MLAITVVDPTLYYFIQEKLTMDYFGPYYKNIMTIVVEEWTINVSYILALASVVNWDFKWCSKLVLCSVLLSWKQEKVIFFRVYTFKRETFISYLLLMDHDYQL